MINYTWKISAFDCTPEKIVTAIHWRYIGTDENNLSFETYGVIGIGEPDINNFTDFENLSFKQVTAWIENIYSVVPKLEEGETEYKPTQLQTLQNNISNQIELLKLPKTITLTPPF